MPLFLLLSALGCAAGVSTPVGTDEPAPWNVALESAEDSYGSYGLWWGLSGPDAGFFFLRVGPLPWGSAEQGYGLYVVVNF